MDQLNDCKFYTIQLQSKIINSSKSNQTLTLLLWSFGLRTWYGWMKRILLLHLLHKSWWTILSCTQPYVKAKVESVEFVNGPQFDLDDWIEFETGTEKCLASIQGNNGVPLSYLLKDNRRRPTITVASNRDDESHFCKIIYINYTVWTYISYNTVNFSIRTSHNWRKSIGLCRRVDW